MSASKCSAPTRSTASVITVGTTTSEGSTVLADGTEEDWERPAIAYYSPGDEIETLGEGDGVTNVEDSALYLFPKHSGAK